MVTAAVLIRSQMYGYCCHTLIGSAQDFGTYHIGEQPRLSQACAYAQSCQSLHSHRQ